MTNSITCQVRDVTRDFRGRPALSGVSIALCEGEVVGVAGPNGAGKSTLARIIGGFLTPSTGQVLIGGRPAHRFREEFGVGFLPEEVPAPRSASVAEFLASRCSRSSAALDVPGVVAALEIDNLLTRRANETSKGQWRLVLAAYATLGPSPVVILDEPDSGLDPDALDRLLALIAKVAELGSVVVILSHHLELIERSCHRTLLLKRGQVQAELHKGDLGKEGLREAYRRAMHD